MNWHTTHKATMPLGARIAEWIARRIGSAISIIGHTAVFAACFIAVYLRLIPLDEMLLWLTTIVSLEAIYIGLFLQNSSNSHSDLSEAQARAEYETTTKAEQKLEEVIHNVARIEDEKIDAILKLLMEPELKARKSVHKKRLTKRNVLH